MIVMRKEVGLSKERAANLFGINLQTLMLWESGKSNPPAYALEELKYFYDDLKSNPLPQRTKKDEGIFFAQVRREAGYTQTEVCELLPLGITTLSGWERGAVLMPTYAKRLLLRFYSENSK